MFTTKPECLHLHLLQATESPAEMKMKLLLIMNILYCVLYIVPIDTCLCQCSLSILLLLWFAPLMLLSSVSSVSVSYHARGIDAQRLTDHDTDKSLQFCYVFLLQKAFDVMI